MRLSCDSSAQEPVQLSSLFNTAKNNPSAPSSHLIQTIPLKSVAHIRRRKESWLKPYWAGAVWDCKHWSSSASLELLFLNAAFHQHLRFEVWPILNPSILLSRVQLNRVNSKRPIKSRKESRTWSLMTLNQIILWHPIEVKKNSLQKHVIRDRTKQVRVERKNEGDRKQRGRSLFLCSG